MHKNGKCANQIIEWKSQFFQDMLILKNNGKKSREIISSCVVSCYCKEVMR